MMRLVPLVHANGIELYYEEIGQGQPLVLIMGLGSQMIAWDERLCQALADQGFRVIRFDNRDVGLSTRLDQLPVPPLKAVLRGAALGRPEAPPYTLSDMARDTVGLLDALGIDRAHIVGVSMGGMIAQVLAIEHSHRVRSLTSIMSHPGGRKHIVSMPHASRALLRPRPRTREEAMTMIVEVFRVIGSPGYPQDEERLRAYAALSFERGHNPRGFMRHLAAILAAPSREAALRMVGVPSLVIHGTADPLVLPAGAVATAAAIPGCRLKFIPGMGHDLPMQVWPIVVGSIAELAGLGGGGG